MEWLFDLVQKLTGVVADGGVEFVTIATSEGVKFLWKKIKGFFKGNNDVPLEIREDISSIDPGDTVSIEQLRSILQYLPQNKIAEYTRDIHNEHIENTGIYVDRGSSIEIHGDFAGQNITKG